MIELTYVKAHLRIDSNAEDTLLKDYIEAAEDITQKYLNATFDELYDNYGTIPAAVRNAICMMVGTMYRDREATQTVSVQTNPAFVALLKPYKRILRS